MRHYDILLNPFIVSPSQGDDRPGVAKEVSYDEMQRFKKGGPLPGDLRRQMVQDEFEDKDVPKEYELRQDGNRYSIFFQGEDTGKYAFSEAKAKEIISRMSGSKVKARRTR